ncbi:hypothetical protein SO802_023469 [Lithocarpus litseifolius]|uniref:Cytochrome P450 n=1 Tax=Lithocarpus litseifolius TaxID=425828 RepID=A0AAW2C6C2_9ROSI
MALLPLLQQSWLELHKTHIHALLFIVLLLSFVYIFKLFRSGKPNFPPSLPKLPIIGNPHQVGTLPHRSLHALSKKYGPIMFLDLGCAPTVVVSSADMKTNDIIFSNRPETTAANFLFYRSTDVAFSQNDDGKIKIGGLLRRVRVLLAAFNLGDFFPSLRTLLSEELILLQQLWIGGPKIWDRPVEFIPERFKDNQVDFKGLDFELIPFGGGRRGCPGISFGVAIAEYVIANLLCWFDWKLPSSTAGKDLDMTEVNAVTVFKKVPLELVAILYSP